MELVSYLVQINTGHAETDRDLHPSMSLLLNTLRQLHYRSWIDSFIVVSNSSLSAGKDS
jgi:hypothetical protein